MSDPALDEAQRAGQSIEPTLAPIRARLAALRSDERVQRWGWTVFPFTLWAVTRVAILGFGWLSMRLVPDLVVPAGLDREYLLRYPSIEGLCRWDCRFFQDVANDGYVHVGYTNFFPLYPLLVRTLHEVTGLHIDVCLALRGNHIWAGVALGVGVLARHLSFFAGGSLLVAQLQQRPTVRSFLLSPALLGLVIPRLFLGT